MKEDIEKIKKIIEKFFNKQDNKIMFVCLVAIIIIPIIIAVIINDFKRNNIEPMLYIANEVQQNLHNEDLDKNINKPLKIDEIQIQDDKSEYKDKNYKDVINKLKGLGFINIIEKQIYDKNSEIANDGKVDSVIINGQEQYKKGDIFNKNTEVIVTYHLKKEDNENTVKEEKTNISVNTTTNTTINTNTMTTNQIQKPENNEKTAKSYNFYTTNSDDKAKDGNSGKYAYVKKGKNYDIYWIIDFEKGYVYDFSEGNGDTQYEKIKIKSGNLNDGLKLSYKDSSNAWATNLHFKYKNQPHSFIIIDNDGFEYNLTTTSLENALKLMESKTEYQP